MTAQKLRTKTKIAHHVALYGISYEIVFKDVYERKKLIVTQCFISSPIVPNDNFKSAVQYMKHFIYHFISKRVM